MSPDVTDRVFRRLWKLNSCDPRSQLFQGSSDRLASPAHDLNDGLAVSPLWHIAWLVTRSVAERLAHKIASMICSRNFMACSLCLLWALARCRYCCDGTCRPVSHSNAFLTHLTRNACGVLKTFCAWAFFDMPSCWINGLDGVILESIGK